MAKAEDTEGLLVKGMSESWENYLNRISDKELVEMDREVDYSEEFTDAETVEPFEELLQEERERRSDLDQLMYDFGFAVAEAADDNGKVLMNLRIDSLATRILRDMDGYNDFLCNPQYALRGQTDYMQTIEEYSDIFKS